jgi:hypothetical protein
MLPVGIAIMVASIAIGVIALTLVALTSSTARSAGRSTRSAFYPSGEEVYAPYYAPAGEGATSTSYQTDAPYQPVEHDAPHYPAEEGVRDYPAEQDEPYYPPAQDELYHRAAQEAPSYPAEQEAPSYPAEVGDAPRWVLVLVALSGGGLLLGLLIVMIASLQ